MNMRLYIEPEQKRRLAERARIHGNTFSAEVNCALDFYLAVDVCEEEELADLAGPAKLSTERIIRTLDKTISYVHRALAKVNRPARFSGSFPRN
jgi:hypothetical protein